MERMEDDKSEANAVVSFDWLMCDFDKKCFMSIREMGKSEAMHRGQENSFNLIRSCGMN